MMPLHVVYIRGSYSDSDAYFGVYDVGRTCAEPHHTIRVTQLQQPSAHAAAVFAVAGV